MTEHESQKPAPSAGELVSEVLASVSSLVRAEVDLARAEISENVNRAFAAIGLIVGAVVLCLVALNVMAGAIVAALVEAGIAPGWSALIVGVSFALIAFGMLAKGTNDLKLSSLAPKRAMENLKRETRAVKESYNV